MARNLKPPPGNTTAAAPVLRPLAAYTVIVGRLTSLALGHHSRPSGGPTDSGFGLGIASGTAPGQIGTCTWPGEGCETAACDCEWADASTKKRITRIGLCKHSIWFPSGWLDIYVRFRGARPAVANCLCICNCDHRGKRH